jgi:hypothetical protein
MMIEKIIGPMVKQTNPMIQGETKAKNQRD